jgi:hypothetical protein
MAITYPLALPTATGIAKITLRTLNSVSVARSPFTYKEQVVSHTGKRWEADITLPAMQEADAEIWVSFLLSLKGQEGTFLLGDPIGATPRGSAATAPGTPLVESSTTSSIRIKGAPGDTTGYLKAGDYIQLGSGSGSKLFKVLADVDINSSGSGSAEVWPNVVSSPSLNDPVTVSNAKGVFRLASNASEWNINEASFYGISFSAIQAIA